MYPIQGLSVGLSLVHAPRSIYLQAPRQVLGLSGILKRKIPGIDPLPPREPYCMNRVASSDANLWDEDKDVSPLPLVPSFSDVDG